MGRLEDILARNRGEKGPRERTIVSIALGLGLLLVIALVLFTDLGLPDSMRHATAGSGSAAPAVPAPPARPRADGVMLGTPRAHADAGASDPASRAP